MSTAKITLFTFAQWKKANGGDLFSNLSLPTGIDRDTLIDNILLRGGEFEVVYSDPDFMEYAIGPWSRKWYRTMQKWIDVLSMEYNPLENYDRVEQWQDTTDKDTQYTAGIDTENTRTHDNTDTRTHADTDTQTNNNKDLRTLDHVDATTIDSRVHDNIDEDDSREVKVSAFDSSDYQPSQYEDSTHDGDNTRAEDTENIQTHAGTITDDHTGTITDAHTGTITDAHEGTITDEYNESRGETGAENTDFMHTGHIHGNIGVKTTQSMVLEELDLAKWNVYEQITDLFLIEFVIPIYS